MEEELFEAIQAGDAGEVRRLVAETPGLVEAVNASGVSATLFAAYNGKPQVAAMLVEMGAPLGIFEASALGRADRIRELLAEDPSLASVYARDGFYPLGLAAFFGHLDAVRVLIGGGADVHATAKNSFKVRPVHAAAASKNLDVLRAVLEAGADPNVPQQLGFVPLHEAATSGNRAMAELLIAHGADPRQCNESGKSSVALARDRRHTDLAEWLDAPRPPKG